MISPRAMPLIIADRGASAEAPEHTIAAFELALQQGADGIGLDVHATRDGQPVVLHDFTLERTTDGAGAVSAHTMREIKRLDAGAWRGRRYRGQRIQTLQEVLERFRERARFWIEIRGGSDLYPSIEERVVSMVEIYEVVDRTLIQSTDLEVLGRIHALNPEIVLGTTLADCSGSTLSRQGPAKSVCVRLEDVTEELAEKCRVSGLDCYVRAGDNLAGLERSKTLNIEGILTTRPSPVRTRLGRGYS